jgi:hypothetical protein
MNRPDAKPAHAAGLRHLAEERLRAESTPPRGETDPQRIIHELQVYQIELEMQNEELRQAAELRRQHEQTLAQNRQLAQFNQLCVDRELRMTELKREVNELCRKLGEPPRYWRTAGEPPPADSTKAQA